jgi:ketosteroid isomerase-like protein
MNAKDIAAKLMDSLGDPDAVAELFSDDGKWWFSPAVADQLGVNLEKEHGKEAIRTMMKKIFGEIYIPETVKVSVHYIIEEDNIAAVRFNLRAGTTFNMKYENEYAMFIHTNGNKISQVYEYLDALHAQNQFT